MCSTNYRQVQPKTPQSLSVAQTNAKVNRKLHSQYVAQTTAKVNCKLHSHYLQHKL